MNIRENCKGIRKANSSEAILKFLFNILDPGSNKPKSNTNPTLDQKHSSLVLSKAIKILKNQNIFN